MLLNGVNKAKLFMAEAISIIRRRVCHKQTLGDYDDRKIRRSGQSYLYSWQKSTFTFHVHLVRYFDSPMGYSIMIFLSFKRLCHQVDYQAWEKYGICTLSTLVQVMGCCLMATTHYLNQCWPIINELLLYSPKYNLTKSTPIIITKICLKIAYLKS